MGGEMSRPARPWLWLLLGALCCIAMVVPARIFATTLPSPSHLFVGPARRDVGHRLLEAGGAWWALYAVAVVALLRAPRYAAAAVGVLTSAGIGAASIARSATTSNDFYRYVWDGRVQAAGIDPYRYAPASEHLDRLRDAWLWPDAATCRVHLQRPGCTLLNRSTVHTIYPPLAQLWFLVEHVIVPQSTRDRGYETAGLLIVVATTGLLLGFLHRTGRDVRQVAIWGCCPAVAIEAVQNAHVDDLAVVFVVLAVWAAERGTWIWASAAVGAAGLVKLYPLVLFPAIVQGRRIRGAVVISAMFVVGYLPHIIAVGGGVTGFLGTYIHQQGYVGGRRYQLLHQFGLHGHVAAGLAFVLIVATLLLALARRLGSPVRAAMVLFAVVLFVTTPGEPWEDLALIALAAMAGAWKWLTVVVAEQAGYVVFIFGGLAAWTGPFGYALALAVSVAAWLARFIGRPGPTTATGRP
jgi:hypothetical protein